MIYKLLDFCDRQGLVVRADAHCDIPCGIYEPATAIVAAHSVVRLMDIMHEGFGRDPSVGRVNLVARNVAAKEEEAEKVKHEIRVIWGDYFKAPHIEAHPEIHALTHSIMQKASACKQDVHREDAEALVELVNQFAEIFWATKNTKTERRDAPFPTGLQMVVPVAG